MRGPRDGVTGLILAVISGSALFMIKDYRLGRAAEMGPGYFPLIIASLFFMVALALIGRGLLASGEQRQQAQEVLAGDVSWGVRGKATLGSMSARIRDGQRSELAVRKKDQAMPKLAHASGGQGQHRRSQARQKVSRQARV